MSYDHFNLLCLGCFQRLETSGMYCPFCGFNEETHESTLYRLPLRTILGGKYMIGRVLGEGGFGITYIAYDLNLDIIVAIKEYYPTGLVTRSTTNSITVHTYSGEYSDFFRKGKERFVDEAKRLARFRVLPGIVMVNDFLSENDTAYIIMEYIQGKTLKNYIDQMGGKLPPEQVFEMLKPVFGSLGLIHESGIIHRDISPDNIMVCSDGSVKLLDFGAAREFDEENKSLSVMLKHGYAPAEQYSTRGEQGTYTDVYALSATIYKTITGLTPENAMDRILDDRLELPSKLGIVLPPYQEDALMKGLAVRHAYRYKTITELYNALYQTQPTSQVQPISHTPPVTQPPPVSHTPPAPYVPPISHTPPAPYIPPISQTPPVRQIPPTQPPPPPAYLNYPMCINCNTPLTINDKFCSKCGIPAPSSASKQGTNKNIIIVTVVAVCVILAIIITVVISQLIPAISTDRIPNGTTINTGNNGNTAPGNNNDSQQGSNNDTQTGVLEEYYIRAMTFPEFNSSIEAAGSLLTQVGQLRSRSNYIQIGFVPGEMTEYEYRYWHDYLYGYNNEDYEFLVLDGAYWDSGLDGWTFQITLFYDYSNRRIDEGYIIFDKNTTTDEILDAVHKALTFKGYPPPEVAGIEHANGHNEFEDLHEILAHLISGDDFIIYTWSPDINEGQSYGILLINHDGEKHLYIRYHYFLD